MDLGTNIGCRFKFLTFINLNFRILDVCPKLGYLFLMSIVLVDNELVCLENILEIK